MLQRNLLYTAVPRMAGMFCRTDIRAVLLLRFAVAWLGACLAPWPGFAAEPLPRSILILEQSDSRSPFYAAIYSGLQSQVNANPTSPVIIYVENLDLSRFPGPEYEQSLRTHLKVKYRSISLGVIVTVGPVALKYALQHRAELWPAIPIVFAFVDEQTIAGQELPADVTGRITRLRLEDMVSAARVVVKGLKRVAIVGDRFETQPVFRHFKDELPTVAAELEVIDLTGLPMVDLRKRVAALPNHSAILYTALFSEGAKVFRRPVDALAMLAEVANRPIVIAIETFLERAGIGGYFTIPSIIGKEAGAQVLRILDGESPASLPITIGDSLRPIFDWREMQRWGVSEGDLPPGSEIRNRVLTIWEAYPKEIAAIAAMVFLQSGLIGTLLYERRRRRRAELEERQRMTELVHMNREARDSERRYREAQMELAHANRVTTMGQLSATIVHEISQPIAAAVINGGAALRWLGSQPPNLAEVRQALGRILESGNRAIDVLGRIRGLMKREPPRKEGLEINKVILEIIELAKGEVEKNSVSVRTQLAESLPLIEGDRVQLQQVILNLIINAVEAMSDVHAESRELLIRTRQAEPDAVLVAVQDTGPVLAQANLERVFEAFYTTKPGGLGMGLSICRSIIEAHGGRLWLSPNVPRGAVFEFTLPTHPETASSASEGRQPEAA